MNSPVNRILLVEDNAADVQLVREVFRDYETNYEFIVANSLGGARNRLSQEGIDIVIVDLMLPDGSGVELIGDALEHHCPTIVLTGHGNEEFAVKALRAGAIDYVTKGLEFLQKLPHTVSRAIREWEGMIERELQARLLLQSEQRFRAFAELSADWFWEADKEMRFTFASHRAWQIAGMQPDDMIGASLKNVCARGDVTVKWDVLQDLWKREQEFEFEVSCQRDSGEDQRLYIFGKPFFDAQQRCVGFQGIVRDIT